MAVIIGVRFKNTGKVYYFDPGQNQLEKGSLVVVETARGIECGEVVIPNKEVADSTIVKPLKPVLRPATPEDKRRAKENAEKEQRAMRVCQEKIEENKVDMISCFTLPPTAGSIFGIWSRISPPFFAPASSCGKLACGTRPRCWGALASAAVPSAAPSFSAIFSPCPSRWPRSRACP